MLKYVGKRILYMIGVFFVVSIILFVLFNNVPGDRALNQVQNLRGKVSDETFQLRYQEAREKLGLDDPIPVRYVKWMGNLLKGNLGYSSFYKKDVKDCLSTPLLNTIQINIVSTILALAITIPLGIHCAVRKFSKFDNTVQVLTIVGYSMPQYIVALVFIFVFAVKLGWFPISGMNTPNFQGTGVAFVLDRLHYLALPVIVMTVAFWDLNNLKMINDNFGHAVGDSLIQTMSEKLLAVSNERCRTYRVGGDEFLLILDDPAPGEINRIIQQVKTELSSGTGTTGLRILAAVGSAEGCGADIRSLVKKADAAMYSDKAKSKEGRS